MLNILFVGSLGNQSLITLNGLFKSGHTVSTVAVAGSTLGLGNIPPPRSRFIPAINTGSTQSILNVAIERGIPIEIIYPGVAPTGFRSNPPDVGIVSCFPHRLQDGLLSLPEFGCFNLHPSLLPEFRGPAPLFWQLRHGAAHTGVTLHRMDNNLDSGDIIAQEVIAIPDGVTETELTRLCTTRGSTLVHDALQQLEQGTLVSSPQNDRHASYQGWPTEKDFQVDADWPVRRISNFIHGTGQRGKTYALRIGADFFAIVSVVAVSYNRMPNMDYSVEGKYLRFNCYDGSVTARLANETSGNPNSSLSSTG